MKTKIARHNRRMLLLEQLVERKLLAVDIAGVGEEFRPRQAIDDEITAEVWQASQEARVDQQAADLFFNALEAEGEARPQGEAIGTETVEFEIDFEQTFVHYDVNFDGIITPVDALIVINALNRNDGVFAFDIITASERLMWEDVNGDKIVSPLDALLVINWLNRNDGPGPVPIPNALPHALEQDVQTTENMPVSIILVGYDANGDDLFYQINSPPLHGSISGDAPNITYTPHNEYTGSDSLAFRVNDGIGWSETSVVTIEVEQDNNGPVGESGISVSQLTPASANLFVDETYHIATFNTTGETTSVTFEVEPIGLEGFDSFYITDTNGQLLSNNAPSATTITIDFLTPFAGNEIFVWTNTSSTPTTYGGAVRAIALNGQQIESTEWSKLHRVNP